MQCNIGKTDRTLRLIAGIGIILAGLATQSWWGAIGLVPLLTGTVRWCPAYTLFGLKTNKE